MRHDALQGCRMQGPPRQWHSIRHEFEQRQPQISHCRRNPKHINEYGYECITSFMYWVAMCTRPPGHQKDIHLAYTNDPYTHMNMMGFTSSARENKMRIDSWFIRRSNPNVAISRSWRFYLPLWVLKTWRRQFWCMHENQMWIIEHLCAAFVLSILLGGNVHAASLPIHRLRVTPCDRAWSGPPRKDCMEKTWTWVDNFHTAI